MENVDHCSKNHRWIVLLLIVISLLVAPYALFRSNPAYALLSESSWSGSFHRVFGWGNTVENLNHTFSSDELRELRQLLNATAFRNKTVILTTLNEAWSRDQSMIDLFLKSFRIGTGTRPLLDHLLIVALDEVAYRRCRDIHSFCFVLKTPGVDFRGEKFFRSSDYLKMMWSRIDFLRRVLELGYNFVFSDADILWFRDPFDHFSRNTDFEIACDHYNGNATDLSNSPNGGFVHVKSNPRTIAFYKLWYQSRLAFLGKHDQEVLDKIKLTPRFASLGLRIRFLSTKVFANFCEIGTSRPATVCTIHSNCCKGLDKKLEDLRGVMSDWSSFKFLSPEERAEKTVEWRQLKWCPKKRGWL
ncbi:uncharacterized protein At4g15970-like [Selaginella moellendorffii]|uniref:uncharacterized protein At4g15970-like n=1 Tax=Selaginella moellendorffii TaxID=88036 RepID=UPI000D1CE821|nr:uncharacterized protein At4g15970-like [Selaginella moellendorffii]|eukprot:XP_024529026.1 uncharacterized protein At4g15970-like [Selaginella moellendorffii]